MSPLPSPAGRRTHLLLSPAACLALTAGLLSACGVPQDDEPRALNPSLAPFDVFKEQVRSAPTGDDQAALYFVRDDRVVRQTRRVEAPADLTAVLDLLLAGPTPQQVEDGIRSALPSTFTVEGVELGSNGVAVVTLGGSSTQISTSPLAFAQVVATLTAPGLARSVRFRLDGQDLPVPRGDASVTEAPVDRGDYAELLAPAGGPASDEPVSPEGADDLSGSDPVVPGPTGSPAPG